MDKKIPFEFESEEGLFEALRTLPIREAEVFCLYFGFGIKEQHTLREIGGYFSLTQERIRQIKEKAIRRLEHKSRVVLYNSPKESPDG